MQPFDVETGLGSLLKASAYLSCFPDLYQMEYRYAERITAHRTILEGAIFGILAGLTKQGFQGLVIRFNSTCKVSADEVAIKLLCRKDDGQSFLL